MKMKFSKETQIEQIKESIADIEAQEPIAIEQYEDYLNDVGQECVIGCLTFTPSEVMKELDNTAYCVGYSDWSNAKINELKEEIKNLE